MPIADLIQREVHCLPPDATCQEAAKLMQSEDIGSVVIVADEQPVGIITDRDLVTRVLASGCAVDKTLIGDVMSCEPIFLEGDRSIERAIHTMEEYGIRRLIVVDDEGLLEGLISFDDLFQMLALQLRALAGATKIDGRY